MREKTVNKEPEISDLSEYLASYTNVERFDAGGFKTVYRGEREGTSEAIKVIHLPKDRDDPASPDHEGVQRIIREIEAIGKCESPYLVKLGALDPQQITINETDDYIIYSEEFLSGKNLRSHIEETDEPELTDLATLGSCMLQVISELWEKGYVHRDIKPENVICTKDSDRPFVLLDLGIAFSVNTTPITKDSKQILGTLQFIDPFMLKSGFRESIDYRSDLYALGLTIYEWAAGVHPIGRGSGDPHSTLYRIANEKADSLKTHRPDLPEELCNKIDQMIKKLPALRPGNLKSTIEFMESHR